MAGNINPVAYPEGIDFEKLDDEEAAASDFNDLTYGLYNELVRTLMAITSTPGICSGGTITANPGGAPYTFEVDATFGVNGIGQVVYLPIATNKTITGGDVGSYIVIRREETLSNPDGRANEYTGDSTNYLRTI